MTRSRSATLIPVPPPLVMLMTASVSDLIALRYSRKTAGSAVGLPYTVAGVQVDDGRSGLGRGDRLRDDVLDGVGQVRRHRGRMARSRHRARDDDLPGCSHRDLRASS